MVGKSETQRRYHGYEMQLEHTIGCTKVVGRYDDDEAEFLGVYLFQTLDDGHMLWERLLQIVRTLVADLHQQGGGLFVDEGIDAVVHVIITGDCPVESFSKRVEGP